MLKGGVICMPRFKYTAVDLKGRNISDTVFANNLSEFHAILKQKEEYCLSVRELSDESLSIRKTSSAISLKELSVYCKQFATMLNAGITIVKALYVLYSQAEKKKMKDILKKLYEQVQVGKSLSEAKRSLDGAFPEFMISMIEAGESSGSLESVMDRLAIHYEKEVKLKNKVTSAMIYPIVLIVVGLAVVFILFTFVIPNLMDMFDEDSLPGITKFLFALSNLMQNSWLILIIGAVVIGLFIYFTKSLKPIKRVLDRAKISMPFIGKLNVIVISSVFCRTMSSVFSSGMSLVTSIELTTNCINNLIIEEKMKDVIDEIKAGGNLSTALAKLEIFPTMMITMLSVGEEAGALDDILDKTSDFYETEADNAIQKMVTLLEPLMIVTLGIIVGVVVIGIMSPIFGMYSNVG